MSIIKTFATITTNFDGSDVAQARDGERLSSQLDKVRSLMADGIWRTLDEISNETGAPQASVSAQLRNLRKAKFGAHVIDRRHVGNGLYYYKLSQ